MRKELKFQCPCGYGFEMFGIANDAISMIKLHVESFRKNYLPFGITKVEAFALLDQRHEEIKPKISKRTDHSPAYSFATTFLQRSKNYETEPYELWEKWQNRANLLKQGFEFVTEMDSVKLFRKRN